MTKNVEFLFLRRMFQKNDVCAKNGAAGKQRVTGFSPIRGVFFA